MSKKVQKTKRQARRPRLEEIEPRILYSADFAPALAPDAALAPQTEQRTVDPSGEFTHADQHQVQTRRHEIVFVDSATPDYEKLVDDIRARSGSERDVEIVLLDAGKDGIGQITRTLAKHQDVSAVHIVAHGTDGSVQLGKTSLNFDSLLKNGSKIKGWGAALAADADILIYGCNVAQSDAGCSLVDALARLTGADVAASADLTGHADLGGDWSLEFQTGAIDTSIVFSQSAVLDWRATLQGVAVGGETRANTTTTGVQDTNPFSPPDVVAMDANGNYVVAWAGEGPGDTNGVFFQRYNANGVAQGGEVLINASTTANSQDSPAVAMDASGNFVIAWRSNNQDGSGTGIYARRYDAAGALQGSEFRVNATTTGGQDNPIVAMNASGTFVVTWVSIGQDGSGAGVYARRYNASGVAQGSEFAVNTTTAGDQWTDSVAMDAAGNFVVTFSSADGNGTGVWMRRFNAAGTALGGEVRVNTATTGEQDWSSLAMAPDGDYVVAWRSVGQDGSLGGIYAQRYDAAGAAQGGEFRVNSTTGNDQQHPAVAMDVNGNFMVVWASVQDAGPNWGIYKQEYNANGTTNGGEVRVNSTTGGDQLSPALAMNAVGQAVVAWAGNGNQAGQVDTSGVFFKRYATALVVDTTSDTTTGSDTSSISALLADKGADGRISLREAITAANNTANANANSPDRIYFNIPGAGVRTINVTGTDLPFISDALIIDGTTQAGFAGSPLVEIDGQGTRAEGLFLDAGSGGSTIKGLIVNRFTWAIRIDGSSNNVITGNFLGTDGTGTVAKGNLVGVWVGTSNNTIGGTSAADRNIISGNTLDGVQISGENGGTGNVVMGNYIGLDVTGTADLGNASQGIALFSGAANNTVGGTAAGAGNVISGNNGEGVRLRNAGTTGNVVLGNLIGTNAAGNAGIANSRQGVFIDDAAANNTIGGTAAGAANTIAHNTTDGVALTSSAGSGNAVLGNAIFSNTGMGIDLLDDNIVLLNDGAKTAGQPNLRMDFPVIQSASLNGTTLTLAGYIGTAAGDTDFAGARVEFFKSPDAAGANGEGQVYLGFLTANASGNFSGTLTVSGLALGERVSATATDTSNSTSEFGVNVSVTGAAPVATNDAYSVNEDSSLTIPAPANWWNTSWSQRKQLTFNNTGQAENLVNFAVLVEIDNTRINYALTQNAGQDLRFVDANGTLLAHEIESWNESGTSYVWVSVPQIDASSGTDYIWMYYGNAAAPDAQNPDAVWDAGFGGVWHLGSNELDSAGTNDGINSNSTNGAGVIASGQSFNGTNAQVYTTTQFSNPQQYTIEAWFRTSSAGGKKIIGFENSQTGTASADWDRHLYVGTDGRLYFGSYYEPTDSEDVANSTTNYADGAWHYAVGVRNNGTDTLSLYVDGVLVDTSPNTSSQNYNGYWRLGGYMTNGWPNGADGYYNGSIDEARVSNQVRTAPWIRAQYLSMSDTFVGFGAAQGMGVLANDTDPNGDLLSAVLVGGPSNAASFTLNANGSFTYTPTANFSGTDSFTYRANDGTSNSNLATVTITVNPVNDAPTISGLAGDALAYVGGSGARVIEQGGNAVAADIDSSNFNGGVLTASITAGGDNAEDVLSIRNQGSGAGQIGLSGANVTYGGTLIGTAAGGSGGTALTITLNANATPTAVTALIRNITYQNTDAVTPTTGARSVSVTLSDGDGGTSAPSVATVNVSASVSPVANNDAYSVNEDGTLAVTWWDSDWTRRSQITFTGNNFGGATNLTDFPVLIALNSGNINYAQTQNQGQDLRFLDANGSPLAYQIESWNESGTSYVWVKVPQVDVGTSDSIWMYYGNASATAGQNPTAVWTAGFSAVYHLNDSGTSIDETTSNNFDGTAMNGAAAATGQIAGGRSFDGTDDYINLGANRALVNSAAGVTLSTWINTSSVTGGSVIMGASTATGGGAGTSRIALERSNAELRILARSDDATSTNVTTTSTALATGVWRYVTAVVDATGDTMAIYVNGVAQTTTGTPNLPGTQFPGTNSQASSIGSDESGGPGYMTGSMDEVRWATVARSAAWVRAEYLSMTGSFVTVGAAQTAGATQGVLGNDSDPNADPLTAVLVSGPANAASFTLNADGTFAYTPTANFSGTDTFTYRANDGTNSSNLGTVTITVNPINDAPTAAITPATYAATEQTSLTLHGTGLSIGDVDAGGASVTATLSVVSGTLTVTAGTTGVGVSGSGSNSVTLTGTLTQINNLLAGNLSATATYIINSNTPPASDTLTLGVNDGGNTGSGGAQSGSDTATINISAVNDAPTATITPATYAATEQTSLTLHGTGLSIADVDAGSASVTATLSVVSGTLTVTAGTTGAVVTGSGSNSVTLTGTLTQINNLLAGNLGATASYLISSDTPPASDTLTLLANDGGNTGSGGALTGSDTATINIGAVNDAPTAAITPATYAATEQTSLTLHGTGLSIGDVDAGGASVTATLSVVSGTLTVTAGTTGVGVSGSGSNSVTLTGTLTQINNLLAGNLSATATYIINSNTPPASDTLTLGVNDGGNTGSGGAQSGSDTATINISAVNDAPTATITPATYAATEQTSLTLHGTGLSIADVDAGSASVTATLSVVSGTLTVTAGTTGAVVTGSGSNSVTLTGTLTQINNLLAGNLGATASYLISSDTPPASDTLTLLANDGGNTGSGGALTGSDTATINIGAVNDAPTAAITPATYAATEQTSLTLHGTGLSIGDVDAGGASVTATLSVVSGTLTVTAGTTGVGVSGSGSNSVTLTGTLTQINNLLAGNLSATATYIINSNTPPASDTLTLGVNDGGNTGSGGAQSGSDTATINISAVNDAPTATITPATYAATEQTSLTLHGTGLSIADVDAGSASVTATLSVVSGTLTVTAGTTGAVVSGSGSNSVTLTGTLTQINNLLAGNLSATATYIINSDAPPASDTLTLGVNDAGNTGSGGAKTGSDTATINISALNDAPTAAITPATYAATEQTSLTLHGTGLTIADVDAGSASVTATLSVVSGTLTVTAGTTGAGVSGSGTNSVTLTGTLTQINNLLAGNLGATASYIISSDATPASDTLTLGVNDGGNTGSGGAQSGSDTATINIAAVNDAPIATITPLTYAATEQTSLTLHGTGLTIADVDAGSASVTATLSVVSGTLTVTAGTTGAGVSGSGTNSVTLTGTLTQVNNLLAGNLGATASYIISSDAPPASDTLTLSVNDGGNTGSGGAQSGADSATINIAAVNDAPIATITPLTYAATEQTSLTLHGTGLTIADVDAGGASVTATLSVVSGTLTVTAGTTGAGVSGSGTNSVTLTGTLTQINNLLAGNLGATASYIINSDTPPVSDTLTLGVNDGGNSGSGGAQTGSDTATINVGAVNDAPVNTVPAAQGTTQNMPLVFSSGTGNAISVADIDAGALLVEITLTATNGTVSLPSLTGLTVTAGANNSATVTVRADLVTLNTRLNGLTFTPTTGFSGAASLAITTGDLGNTGTGGPLTAINTINITVNLPSAPTASNDTYSVNEDASLPAAASVLGNDTDPGAPGGLTAHLVSGPSHWASFVLNANGTFSYTPTANFHGTDSFTYFARDGSDSNVATVTITVNSVNDAPVGANNTVTAAEDAPYTFTAADFALSDPSDVPANALLAVTITTLPGAGSLTLSAVAVTAGQSITAADFAAGNLQFTPAAQANGTSYASFTFQVQDDGGTVNSGANTDPTPRTMTIDVSAVNDAPTASIAAGSYSATEQTSLALQGTGLSIGDVDAGGASVTATLSVVSGTLSVNAGTTGAAVSGSGTNSVTLTGTLTQINNLLAGNLGSTASYLITSDIPPASDTLTLGVNDGGNTGSGGAQSASAGVAISIAAVNDAPTATITPASYAATEQTNLTLQGTGLSIADADAGGAGVTATLSVVSGSLTVSAGGSGASVSGSGTNSVTLIGTLAQINDLLTGNLGATVSYIIGADAPPASDALTLSVNDGGNSGSGGAQSASDSAIINIGALNDAPTASIAAGSYSATEQVSLALQGTGLSIGDVDAGGASVTATLSVVSGTLTVSAGTTGAAVSGSGTNSVTLTGTLTQINDLLAGNLGATASYLINSDTPPASDTLTLSVNDGGNTGSGGAQSASANASINIGAVNDAPTATITPPTYAATEQTSLTLHGTGLSIADVDAGGADITAILSVVSGTLNVNAGTTGVTVGGSGGNSVTLSGTFAQINDLLAGNFGAAASYVINSDTPPGSDTLTLSVDDDGNTGAGGVQTGSDTATINISAVNDAPTATITPASYAATEQTSLTLHGTGLSIADVDAGGASVTATLSVVSGTLTVTAGTTGAAVSGSGTNSVTLTGTLTQINDLLAGNLGATASYLINSDTPPASDTLTLSVNDGGNTGSGGVQSASTGATIIIGAVNDAPSAAIVPASYAATEQVGLTLHGTGLSIADADAGGASVTATLSVVSGTLTVSAGGSGALVSGSGSDSVTLTGTLTQINDLLAGNLGATVSYLIGGDAPPASDTLTLSVNDGGNSGSGGAQSASDSATISIGAVNDAPTVSIAAGSYSASEQVSLVLHGTGLSIGDVDAGGASVTATLSVVSGALTVNAGTTGVVVGGSGSNAVTLSGTLAQITDLLAGNLGASASYLINSDTPPGSDTLTLSVNDAGNTGSGGAQSASANVTINIGAVNDAPSATIVPASYAATEQTSLILHGTGLSIADVDAGGADVTATLSVVSGTLTVSAGGSGVSVVGSGTDSVTLTGTLTQINNLLAGNLGATASYLINSDTPPASDTLTLSVNDGGNSGSGGAQSDSASATINIGAVNDGPAATITPVSYVATEQTSLTLEGTGLAIGDVDAGGASVTATMSVVSGTLTASAGTTGVSVSGSGSDTVTLIGTLAQINDLLAGNLDGAVSYLINSDAPPASDTLTLSVDDGGNLGSGGAMTASDTAIINISGVNDAPAATIAAVSYAATEQTSLTLHGTGLSIADVDADGASVTATLSVVSGTLNVTAGATGVTVGGSGGDTVTLTGALAAINDLLAGNSGATASYVINSDTPPAFDTLTLSVDDDGNTGSGGAQSGSDTATIDITALNDAPTGAVVIIGAAIEDDVLSADTSSIADADGSGIYSYQWERSTDGGTTWSAIGGATASIYTLRDADVNALVQVSVSYTDGGGTVESLTSASVGPVANVNDAPTGAVTVVGTVTEDQTLTADTSSIDDADGLGAFGYQWLRDGAVIVGATSGTYTLGDADVGTQISVDVSYTDAQGTSEGPLTSAQTAAVANVNDVPIGVPTISGTVTEDQTLTANTGGIADADALGAFSYQWLRNGAVILGATSGTYTLGDADVGTQISVEVSYTDGHGTPESVTSAQTAPVVNVNDSPTGVPTITGTVIEDQTLTADTGGIADADGLGAFGYQWLRNGAVILGATSGTYTLGDADVGTQISVEVSYTDAHGTSEGPLLSAQTAAVVNVNDAPIGLPTITGTVIEDQTLTANTGGIADADGLGAYSYQWLRNGAVILGATSGTYTLGDTDVGTQISVEVSYTDGHGTSEGPLVSAQTAPVANVNDVPTGLPTITGTVTEDQTLTANTGGIADADGLGAFGYQWLRNGAAILGATSGTYTLGDADVGTQISVEVSYTDAQGTSEGPLTSAQTAAVANVNDVPIGVPTISGTVTEDQTLTANTGGIADADALGAFSYQWLRNGAVILGATSGTYTLGDADVGTQISVEVSYTDGHGTPESVTSAQTAPVVNVNDSPTGVPTITGTVIEDQTLTADTGGIADADGLGAFGYQWLRNGAVILGATSGTYTLGDADVGTQISVEVSYTDAHGTSEGPLLSAQTAAVVNVNDAPIGLPTITGTVIEDQTLTANTGGIADADGLGAYSYQWLRNGAVILGATSGTYTLGDTDVGTQISVEVSYTDGHGTSEGPLVSAQTAPVANVNDVPTGLPTITGTVTEDQTLTANTGGIADADGLGAFGYQWLRNGAAILGATSGTYTLGDADVGTQISVEVSYTDAQGTSEGPLTSAQTAAVANINDAPIGLPTITGTVIEDQTLTANTGGIADADGLGAFGYQWLRNGAAILGATSGTYTLGDADVGTQISVEVSYTDAHGTSEGPLLSAQTAAVVNVNDAPIGLPTITGTVIEDQTLTADTSSIADADGLGAYSYQWLRNGAVILGATSGTYTLGDADVGMQISVEVSYTDGHGTAESVTSAQTAPVVNINDAPTGVPTIVGTVIEDQTLTANIGGIADADGLGALTYQWARSSDGGATWVSMAGATANTYTLGDADVNAFMQVSVSYTDAQGATESLTSAGVGPVTNLNDAPVLTANGLSIGQGATLTLSGTNLGASDVDDAASTLTFTVSNVANGRFELSGVPGVGITSFTQADVAGGVVVFVHDGGAIAPSYAVTVSDGSLMDGPLWAGISFMPSAVVTPPVLPPPPVIVPTPVTNEPPAVTQAAAEQPEAPASAPARVVPAVFSPGRIDPPEAQISSLEIHGLAVRRLIQPVATLNTFVSGPYIDPTLQLLAAAPANLEYLPSVPVDWSVRPAFPDAEEAPRDRIDVLLEQVQVGGMALSVGVVWWASRISGLLGSLLASAPAWRHIDPLPVVGRDEDEEKKWYDPNDRDAEANELAIDDVFEGAHTAKGEQQA